MSCSRSVFGLRPADLDVDRARRRRAAASCRPRSGRRTPTARRRRRRPSPRGSRRWPRRRPSARRTSSWPGRRRARAPARRPAAGRSSPAEPPAQRIEPGSRLKSATSCSSERYLDFAGTTMPSLSVIIVAIGVVRESGTSEPLVSIAPSITSPVIISWYGSPEDFETSWESPSVPPAPSTLKTSMPSSSFESCDARLERARGRVPAAARGRRGHDRELPRGVRLGGVIAPGGAAWSDDRDHRRDRQRSADEHARPLQETHVPPRPHATILARRVQVIRPRPCLPLALLLAACGDSDKPKAQRRRPPRRRRPRSSRVNLDANRCTPTPGTAPRTRRSRRRARSWTRRRPTSRPWRPTAARSRSRSTPSAPRRPAARSSSWPTSTSTTGC